MKFSARYGTFCAFSFVACLVGGPALAESSPSTAEVLGKLHGSNVKEMQMGKLAQERGQSNDVKKFGKTLVKDHDAADTKVAKLAKKEGIDLAANTPAVEHGDMPTDDRFDTAFAKDMLEDHEKDVAEVKAARDATSDKLLKSLLGELLPVLEKHRATAQKLVDQRNKT